MNTETIKELGSLAKQWQNISHNWLEATQKLIQLQQAILTLQPQNEQLLLDAIAWAQNVAQESAQFGEILGIPTPINPE